MRFLRALGSAFSVPSLLLALLFLAMSLTPSLIPRGPVVQGVLGGVVMALGYITGRILELIWQAADLPRLTGRAAVIGTTMSTALVLALLGWSFFASFLSARATICTSYASQSRSCSRSPSTSGIARWRFLAAT